MKAFGKSQKGFTLMELIVILAILGILSAVLVPNVSRFIGKGVTEASAAELQAVQQAVDLFIADTNATSVPVQALAATDLSISTPPLYPNYARFATVGRVGGYTWDATGKVSGQGSWTAP